MASLPRLQHLSLSENHLPVVVGLEACPLLQFINLQQNNLQEVTNIIYLLLIIIFIYSVRVIFQSCSIKRD